MFERGRWLKIATEVLILADMNTEGSRIFVMRNNRLRLIKFDGGSKSVVRSRNRLIRLYNALRQEGGWRAVQEQRGAKNVAIVYNFAVHGKEPVNLEDRKACFLPARRCPSCKRPMQNNKPHEHKVIPQWMKVWRALPKEKRDALIRGLMSGELTVIKKVTKA